jgi:hypothetical protein
LAGIKANLINEMFRQPMGGKTNMSFRKLTALAVATVIGAGAFWASEPAPAQAQANEMFIPLMVYRTGPYAASGIPLADAFQDYLKLLNVRDGGINGVKMTLRNVRPSTITTGALNVMSD